jgi:EAL domain-containing protein (putative c-di-GMP-specific phosphodiesterase class I)
MDHNFSRPANVGDAILVDEVGIETGLYGPYHLRTMYQPVYSSRPEGLVPSGVEGLVRPYLEGQPIAPAEFLNDVPVEDRLFIESMCRALHLRNHRNIGVEGLDLYFHYDPRFHLGPDWDLGRIESMVERLYEIELDPRLLICEISEDCDSGLLGEVAGEMHRHGMRIAMKDFGSGDANLARVEILQPEIVKLDGPWYRRICELETAARLLSALADALRRENRKLLISGIESIDQLRTALDTGADLLQGYLLGVPKLAGTYFEMDPIRAETLTSPDENVVPLFSHRKSPS